MNANVIRAVVTHLGVAPREFAAGWLEGRTRYMLAPHKDVIAGSIFARGSTGFAASQAAVAFHQGLDDKP